MIVALAQVQSIPGDVRGNKEKHLAFCRRAVEHGVGLIVFPEMSLTSYSTECAELWAIDLKSAAFSEFQDFANQYNVQIAIGAPVRTDQGLHIGMPIFSPNQTLACYYKHYLHEDELPYFSAGEKSNQWLSEAEKIAPAICYESSVDEHLQAAAERGAQLYLASVVKFPHHIPIAYERLPRKARQYQMAVAMVNGVGRCEGGECAGSSAVWSTKGELLAQLDDKSEGVLYFDLESRYARTELL